MKSRTNFFKCLWISAISGRSSENSPMQSDAYSSSFLRKTTAESCDQEGWMVSGSRVLLLFIAWRPAGGADWPYQLCRLHLYQEGQLLFAFPLQLCWFGSFMIWAEQKHYLNMLAIRINIDYISSNLSFNFSQVHKHKVKCSTENGQHFLMGEFTTHLYQNWTSAIPDGWVRHLATLVGPETNSQAHVAVSKVHWCSKKPLVVEELHLPKVVVEHEAEGTLRRHL